MTSTTPLKDLTVLLAMSLPQTPLRTRFASAREAAASNASASKLSLAKSLQEALTTNAGLSEDQFNKIWADACSASGN